MPGNIDVIIGAIDFIEENLKNDVSVLDVSNAVHYSLYHFIRMFEAVTGHSPKDYILRRRIAEAAGEINSTDKKIIDIAFDYQFGTHESFSRAFKRILGINPNDMRKREFYPQVSFLTPITKEALMFAHKARETEVEIVKLPEIRLAGMVTLIRDDKEIIGQLWNLFCNEINRIESRVQPERFYGHSFWSNHYDLEGFFLMVAVEVKDFTSVPIPLCTRTIQPAKYLKFIHKGIVDNIEMTYKYIFQTYLPKTDYRLTHPYDFELYGKNFKNGREPDSETEIYIPIE